VILNPELLKILEDTLANTNKLLSLMETDRDDMHNCINGEILTKYQQGSDEIIKTVKEIKSTLIILQDKQRLGL
jgi:hypothetical protein